MGGMSAVCMFYMCRVFIKVDYCTNVILYKDYITISKYRLLAATAILILVIGLGQSFHNYVERESNIF